MARKLTTFSKLLITLLVVGAIFFGGKWIMDNTAMGEKVKDTVEESTNSSSDNNDNTSSNTTTGSVGKTDVLKVQVFTWAGYAPGIYFNQGAKPNANSRFRKEYGFDVEFVLIDDFDASRNAWISNQVHLLGNEVSAMPTEMERLAPHNPKILLQCDWSRGGDAIIANRTIKSVNDLRGKKVAFALYTPSETFLIQTLASAGMTQDDITVVEMKDPIDAANAFKGGSVDAAVVWSPDDILATRAVPGSKVLISTKQASNVIADVFMVKDDFLQNNRDMLNKFYEGWMKGAKEINDSKSNYDAAAKHFADLTQLPLEDAKGAFSTVRFTTHGDNVNFFGLNPNFKGVTGSSLYNKIGNELEKLGRAPNDRPSWRQMSYTEQVKKAMVNLGDANASAEVVTFSPVTEKVRKLPAIATKPVTINFSTGQFRLDENAKTIIDLQFGDIAKSYANSRVRIEGNTDNVGSAKMNKQLSLKRANSVADYLKEAYGITSNRIIIEGNGPDNPVEGCEDNSTDACKAKNRRTDFQIVGE